MYCPTCHPVECGCPATEPPAARNATPWPFYELAAQRKAERRFGIEGHRHATTAEEAATARQRLRDLIASGPNVNPEHGYPRPPAPPAPPLSARPLMEDESYGRETPAARDATKVWKKEAIDALYELPGGSGITKLLDLINRVVVVRA